MGLRVRVHWGPRFAAGSGSLRSVRGVLVTQYRRGRRVAAPADGLRVTTHLRQPTRGWLLSRLTSIRCASALGFVSVSATLPARIERRGYLVVPRQGVDNHEASGTVVDSPKTSRRSRPGSSIRSMSPGSPSLTEPTLVTSPPGPLLCLAAVASLRPWRSCRGSRSSMGVSPRRRTGRLE